MSYTLSGLQTKVQNKIKDSGFSTSVITDYLNDAQNDLFNEYDLRFLETSINYTLNAGSTDITAGAGLPTDFVNAVSVVLTTSGYEKELPYRDIYDIDANNPDATDTSLYPANVPESWYMFGGTVRVFPTPNAGYTVTLRYKKRPTELSNASDIPSIPQEFGEYLVLAAAGRAQEDKDNYDQALYLLKRAEQIGAKLVNRYAKRQPGPTVMKSNRISHNATGK